MNPDDKFDYLKEYLQKTVLQFDKSVSETKISKLEAFLNFWRANKLSLDTRLPNLEKPQTALQHKVESKIKSKGDLGLPKENHAEQENKIKFKCKVCKNFFKLSMLKMSKE